jgi:anti-sigma factor RsiW
MTHPREDLTALLDGALAPERATAVEAHLDACPSCRAEVERLRAGLAALAALPPAPEPPPFFAARLEARLREERARPRGLARWLPRPRVLAWSGAAAAAALAVAAIPVRSYLETRAMVRNLELLEDWDTASAVGVDSPEDAEIVAQLDQLSPEGTKP